MAGHPPPSLAAAYSERARRPLTALAAILPLLAAYEIGWLIVGRERGVDVAARLALRRGADALAELAPVGWTAPVVAIAPPAALVAALLAAHVIRGDPWRVRAGTCLGLWLESAALTLPLFVISAALFAEPAAASAPLASPALPWQLLLGIGAGLYEELLFRLFGVSGLARLFAGRRAVPRAGAAAGAVVVTSLLFAAHHFLPPASFEMERFVFLGLAGGYLGGLYVLRGFGVAVLVHAFYDTLVACI